MHKKRNIEKVEGKLLELDDKIDNISSYISEYRNLVFPRIKENPAVLEKEKERVSLFDGTFQNMLSGLQSDLITGSEQAASFYMILDNTTDAVLELNKDGSVADVNPAFFAIFKYSPADIKDLNIYSLINDDYHDNFRRNLEEIFSDRQTGKNIEEGAYQVFRAETKYGEKKSCEFFFVRISRDGKPAYYLVVRDLSFNQSLMSELKESKDNYDALSETISEVIIRISDKFKILFANTAVKEVFGYDREELIGKDFSMLFPASVFQRYETEFKKYFYVDYQDRMNMGLHKVIEILGKNKNRGVSPLEMSFGNSKDFSGRTLTCIVRDITKRKNTERKLRHLAYHDKLTSLGNRDLFNMEIRLFFKDIEHEILQGGALMFLDLDGFKHINDTFGHFAGDELLVQTGKRLRSTLRETDGIYRFGGDEFVILLRGIKGKSEAAVVAGNVLNEIRNPYTLESTPNKAVVDVSVSIGISLIPENGRDVDTAAKNADLAMYRAKETGKNRFVFFSKELKLSINERWDIEQGLKHAITNDEIRMHYQPIVDGNGKVKGFEALIRWTHPVWGYVSPDKYIPIAEETGFIITLGNWILETSCRDLKRINSHTWGKNLYVSINLSTRQFDHKDLEKNINSVIRRTGVNSANLRFELTETSIMSAPERVTQIILGVKKLHPGIKFVIDDFGTGYSSLSYLSQLPVDSLKIDISFVTKLFHENNQKIVNSILNLSDSLDLEVVAEGIEQQEQSNYFTERNCNSLQGFLYSRALSIEALEKSFA